MLPLTAGEDASPKVSKAVVSSTSPAHAKSWLSQYASAAVYYGPLKKDDAVVMVITVCQTCCVLWPVEDEASGSEEVGDGGGQFALLVARMQALALGKHQYC